MNLAEAAFRPALRALARPPFGLRMSVASGKSATIGAGLTSDPSSTTEGLVRNFLLKSNARQSIVKEISVVVRSDHHGHGLIRRRSPGTHSAIALLESQSDSAQYS